MKHEHQQQSVPFTKVRSPWVAFYALDEAQYLSGGRGGLASSAFCLQTHRLSDIEYIRVVINS